MKGESGDVQCMACWEDYTPCIFVESSSLVFGGQMRERTTSIDCLRMESLSKE